ncbi:alpha/beta fold hydrolase [Micromonospora globbae]|uniref:alpha/beta fold hydrolase n=1 Tax=Micromonospora globbae TaxID=1894969 RepID=UPI003421C27F
MDEPSAAATASSTELESWTGPAGRWMFQGAGTSGRPVLLIHGMMFDHMMWRPIVDDLARDHRVLAVDLPGHGACPARPHYVWNDIVDDLAALVSHLQLDAPVVVGHSAAVLALLYAGRHPVSGVANVDQPLDIRGLATRLRQAAPGLTGEGFNRLADALIASMDLAAVPEPYRAYVEPHPDRATYLGWQQELLGLDPDRLQARIESAARAIRSPYLAVFSRQPWSGHDEWLRNLIPTAEIEVYGNQGHFPHLADVARFTTSIRRFERRSYEHR